MSHDSTGHHSRSGLSRHVLSIMGLFSGMQAVGILCSLVKMKLVALWLSATGVGLFGIFSSTADTVATFTDLGIRQSAVRDIAAQQRHTSRLATVVAVVRRWSLWAGLLGSLIVSGGSVFLSELFFGVPDHWPEFVLLSVVMLLNSLINGEQAILQGTGSVKRLAAGVTYGTVAGLALSIPMFRFMGEASVVPSILAYSAAILTALALFRYRPADKIRITTGEAWRKGGAFIRLGVMMSIATFISNMAHLLFTAYLARYGSTQEVGYFQAGNTLVIRYVGLLLTSVGYEFYPRLAAHVGNPRRSATFVSHEIVLLTLVLTPVILLFLVCRTLIVPLLYSYDFMPVVPFISWAILCCIFRGVGWSIGTTIMARGDGKIYILTESLDSVVGLTLNVIFYRLFGLAGIGMSYIIWYAVYMGITAVVYYFRYDMRLTRGAILLPVLSTAVCFMGFGICESLPWWAGAVYTAGFTALYAIPIVRLYRRR